MCDNSAYLKIGRREFRGWQATAIMIAILWTFGTTCAAIGIFSVYAGR
jgi:hypothetical protein